MANSHNTQRPMGGLLPTPVFNHSEGCFYPPFQSMGESYAVVQHSDVKKRAKRVCPRCVHGLIILGIQLHDLPIPTDTPVSELSANNLISTLYPNRDQAADFKLVLDKYELKPRHLTHFSRECPLSSSHTEMQAFSMNCKVPLTQLTAYKRDVSQQMRKNRTCIRCGREYFGTRVSLLSEHGKCSFWDTTNSSLINQSKFISTATSNIIPSND